MNACLYRPRLLVNPPRLIKSTFRPNCSTHSTFRTRRCSKSYTSLTSKKESRLSKENSDPQHEHQYIPIEDVEQIERYRPGGYHPATIGEQLSGKYSIVHKLGYGTYSTIWLARDQEAGRYVAIKIAVAESDPGTQEVDILRQLNNTASSEGKAHPGSAYIPSILDVFCHSGPNGVHRCYVMEPGMTSLRDAKDASYMNLFQLPVARVMVAQLVQAVAFLHSQGIVHGGSIDSLSLEQLYEKHGSPEYEPVERIDKGPIPKDVPENVPLPVWLGKKSELVTLSEAKIILTDFGASFMPAATTRDYSNAPGILTPPEVHFEKPMSLSFSADIWTLACTIWSIIAQRTLFDAWFPTPDRIIEEQVRCLGKLPEPWWGKWDARGKSFNEDGRCKKEEDMRTLEHRFADSVREPRQKEFAMQEMQHMGEVEKGALLSMIRAMLAFRPEERATVDEVLRCEWMQRWALPEFDRAR